LAPAHILAGYQRFRANGWPEQRRLFETLARKGQSPSAMVLGCVDSRVDPGRIFDASPGEILTVRNVANLVPPYAPDAAYHGTSAAIEFGVRVLQVPDIIVLGHGLCGGVKALLEGAPDTAMEFVAPWMAMAITARDAAMHIADPEERQRCCEHEVIRISLAHLMTFPWLAERVAAGQLALHGAWFDVRFGTLMMLREDGSFTPADDLEVKTVA
jgi:carbonic anhydrase